MDFLQIGHEDWTIDFQEPAGIRWYYTSIEDLPVFLDRLKEEKRKSFDISDDEEKAIHLDFRVLLTSVIDEAKLEPLMEYVESFAVFYLDGVNLQTKEKKGFFRRKLPQKLTAMESKKDILSFLSRICFPSQYGAKLKLPEIDVNPQFIGEISYSGHVTVNFKGDFGEEFTPLFSYRQNLSSFPVSLELWQEYIKDGSCQIQIEITPMYRGSYHLLEPIIIEEDELQKPYVLPVNTGVGHYAVTIFAKGRGLLQFGPMHWRYSREGYGNLVLGGKRKADKKRQEFFYYFNPGDMRPPLNVYFSGYRPAEGFEGFQKMKLLSAPFLLIADPRIEGGSFYIGSEEFEQNVIDSIQESLDYLGFSSSQLILTGLSMGTYGALYYAAHFKPCGVVVGKPFTNLGDTVRGLKLTRPNEFETAGDVLLNIIGDTGDEAEHALNQKFWKKFLMADFSHTQFALAYMENDDYDINASRRLIGHLSETGSHVFAKGYEGRHTDNSRAINAWFFRQIDYFLREEFERRS